MYNLTFFATECVHTSIDWIEGSISISNWYKEHSSQNLMLNERNTFSNRHGDAIEIGVFFFFIRNMIYSAYSTTISFIQVESQTFNYAEFSGRKQNSHSHISSLVRATQHETWTWVGGNPHCLTPYYKSDESTTLLGLHGRMLTVWVQVLASLLRFISILFP